MKSNAVRKGKSESPKISLAVVKEKSIPDY